MEVLGTMRALYAYNEWANNRVLAAASDLSEEELGRNMGASFGSVQGNLVHTLAGQVYLLAAWMGSEPVGMPRLEEGRVLEAIRESYAISHEGLWRFLGSADEADLTRMASNPGRPSLQRPLWQLMLHVVNHGTHHRAETAMLLTSLGKSPGQLDYLFFEQDRP